MEEASIANLKKPAGSFREKFLPPFVFTPGPWTHTLIWSLAQFDKAFIKKAQYQCSQRFYASSVLFFCLRGAGTVSMHHLMVWRNLKKEKKSAESVWVKFYPTWELQAAQRLGDFIGRCWNADKSADLLSVANICSHVRKAHKQASEVTEWEGCREWSRTQRSREHCPLVEDETSFDDHQLDLSASPHRNM